MLKVLVPMDYRKLLVPVLKKYGITTISLENEEPSTVLKRASDVSAIILNGDPVSADMMRRLPHLRIIARTGVGYDNVDLNGATRQGIWVTNTPGANAVAVAENTVADLLILSKHLYSTSVQMRGGRSLATHHRYLLAGKTVGIVGFGHIARQVIRMLSGFGVKILIWDRHPKHSKFGKFVDWDTLIHQSDYVSLHIPATPQTRHIININVFRAMKNTAFIVNFGRGALINQSDLVTALRTHEIAGAGLDVFEKEPLPLNSQLRKLPNVFLTPHCAGSTVESHRKMGLYAAKNVIAVLNHRQPLNPVNRLTK